MSGIGGWLDRSGALGAHCLPDMSRALLWRGGERREGYCTGPLAVFENQGEDAEARPAIARGERGRIILVMDGAVEGGREAVLSAYGEQGSRFADSLRGSFALAICDEGRGELLLARSDDGKHPLFYTEERFGFRFSSEIKGLLAVSRGLPEVDRGRLAVYLSASEGILFPEFLYNGIYALPKGKTALCGRLGMCLFANGAKSPPEREKSEDFLGLNAPSRETLRTLLWAGLMAYDAPFFPLPRQKGKELKRMETVTEELLGECDPQMLSYLFEGKHRAMIEGERETAHRIRLMAMMIQTVWWSHRVVMI